MKFDTTALRRLPVDFIDNIRDMPTSPLILIKKNGMVRYGNDAKDHIIEDYEEKKGDILIFSWKGYWRTDVFLITNEDLKKYYQKPEPKLKPPKKVK